MPLPPTPTITLVNEDVSTADGAVLCQPITGIKAARNARTALKALRYLESLAGGFGL